MDILVQKFINVNTHYIDLNNKDKVLVSLFFNKDNMEYIKQESFKYIDKPLNNKYLADKKNQQLELMLRIYNTTNNSTLELKDQIIYLNRKCVQSYVNQLRDEVKFYENYEHHASKLPVPLALPKNEHKKGLNTLQENGYKI